MKHETEIVEKMPVNSACTGYDEEYMKNVHVQSASRTRYSTTSASFPLEFKVINRRSLVIILTFGFFFLFCEF